MWMFGLNERCLLLFLLIWGGASAGAAPYWCHRCTLLRITVKGGIRLPINISTAVS